MAATGVGLRDEELQVEDVAVRILPQLAKPRRAAATFDLVRVRGGEAVARESCIGLDPLLVPAGDFRRDGRSRPR